ncbi:MAG TPA: T9SS type A sorting domain-containing protein, partial [Bacteroidia bacterium]|nr:T9SS type A sorting domain-containing protein [Bacteroidia bacterium]
GLNEVQSHITSIVIFPNPNNGDFTISVPESGYYTIVNSIGQVVENIEVKDNSQAVSVTSLADGIYYLIGKSAKAKIVVNK